MYTITFLYSSELLLAEVDFITLAKTSVRWIRPEIDKKRETLDDFRSVCPFDPSTHGVSVILMHDFEKKRKYASHKSGAEKRNYGNSMLTKPG